MAQTRANIEALAPAPTIGRISRITGLTQRAIRYYEDVGLIAPVRDPDGRRLYSKDVQRRLEIVVKLRQAGLAIKDVQAILDTRPAPAQWALAVARLEARAKELDQARQQTVRLLKAIAAGGLASCHAPDDARPVRSQAG
jgi:DNA-binding transcriptional MerR regulator